MVIAPIEWERLMTTNIDHELTEAELDQVAGGKPSAAPKQEAFPTETIKFSYGPCNGNIPRSNELLDCAAASNRNGSPCDDNQQH
jgi:hypothetical protein